MSVTASARSSKRAMRRRPAHRRRNSQKGLACQPGELLYRVVVRADAIESLPTRLSMIDLALWKLLQGIRAYEIKRADYLEGCVEVLVVSDRVVGIDRGQVTLEVERLSSA